MFLDGERRSGKRVQRSRLLWPGSAVFAYVAGATIWLYAVAANSDDYGGSPGRSWVVLGAFVLGLVVGRWPVTLVTLLLPVLAFGAGRGTNPDSDIPIAGEMVLLVMPASLVAAAIGVGLSATPLPAPLSSSGAVGPAPGSHMEVDTVADLLGTCTIAGFAETVTVWATATDGWSPLSGYDRSAIQAFALAPH